MSTLSRQARETALALSVQAPPKEELFSLSKYLKDFVHENYSLAATVLTGTAYHHGKLPMHVRKVIECAMTDKLIKNIACTTTLMQGINMPAQNIIIRNPHLYVRYQKGVSELSSYEMANLRGRAGRLLKDFIGRTYVLDENEFLSASNEYKQESLFENTYKELDSSYKTVYDTHKDQIKDALSSNNTSDTIPDNYSFLVIHIRQSILRHGEGAKKRLHSIGISLSDNEFLEYASSLSQLKIPKEICIRNRYWDPLVLNSLYIQKDLPPVPTTIGEKNLSNKLRAILKYLRDSSNYNTFFEARIPSSHRDRVNLSILCDTAVKWAWENPLKDILVGKYYEEPENIERTISLLQNTISFDLPVLLRPIYDVQGKEASFLTFLEAGAYMPLTRKLIEIGIPRDTAIYLAENYFKGIEYSTDNLYETIKTTLKNNKTKIPYWIKTQISFLL